MANKIARGTTGQATFLGNVPYTASHSFFDSVPDSWGTVDSLGSVYVYPPLKHAAYSPSDTQGFSLSRSGKVFVPLTAYETGMIMGITKVPLHDGNGGYNVNDSTDYWEFEVVCMLVSVRVSKGSSAPISGTSPQQYKHTYTASAVVQGGTAPFTYFWSTTEGSITASSASGDSITIEVINTSPNDGGVSGTAICEAFDSDGCSDANSADFGADASGEGPYPCTATTRDSPSAGFCTSRSCGCGAPPRHCTQVTGNNAIMA